MLPEDLVELANTIMQKKSRIAIYRSKKRS